MSCSLDELLAFRSVTWSFIYSDKVRMGLAGLAGALFSTAVDTFHLVELTIVGLKPSLPFR